MNFFSSDFQTSTRGTTGLTAVNPHIRAFPFLSSYIDQEGLNFLSRIILMLAKFFVSEALPTSLFEVGAGIVYGYL